MILTEKDGVVTINIKVVPRSSKNSVEYLGDILKIKLKSPPVDGKANEELINFLSKILNIKKKDIKIKQGETSKLKTLNIKITKNEFLKVIGGIDDKS